MKSKELKNECNCGCNRHQFLEVTGTAAAGMFALPMINLFASELEPLKLSVKQGAKVKTVFFYPPSETFANPPDGWWSWPGNEYDAEGHQRKYSEEIRKINSKLNMNISINEKSVANLFEFTCKNEGASGLSYITIIMSGTNHSYGHYHAYDRTLNDGDFIILDAGPDYYYYDVDISTTFPANGKFNEKQRECYELALLVSETCIKSFKPGITLGDVGNIAKKILVENGYNTDNGRYQGSYRLRVVPTYNYGGYNHSIGMAVHDGMGTFNGTDEILKPGFVFACDIMTRADSVTSVRIEETVLITEDGCEVLSKGLPRSIKEIEKFMKK